MSRKNKILAVFIMCISLVFGNITVVNAESSLYYDASNFGSIENSERQYVYHLAFSRDATYGEINYITIYTDYPIAGYVTKGTNVTVKASNRNLFDFYSVTIEGESDGNVKVSQGSAFEKVYTLVSGLQVTILFSDFYMFGSQADCDNYLNNGTISNVLNEPQKFELKEDNTQGFEQFQVCRVRDSSISGGYGALVTYELPSGTFVDGKEKKIVYNLTYSFDLGCNTSFSLRDKKSGSVSFTVEDDLTKDYGQREFDFIKLCEESDAFSSSDILTIIRSMNNYCKQKGIPFTWDLNIPLGVLDIGTDGTFASYESFSVDYLDLSISAYYTDGVFKSKESYAYIDLVEGINQSTAINGDDVLDDGTISEGETIKKDNMMDVKKQLNPDGTISYVDVSVDVNIDGSGGGAGSVTQNNNVTIPDEITVNLNGYWSDSGGSGDNITIEDDDYSPDALKNVIDGAYGVFDNLSTEKNDDGFLALLTGFLGALNPDLGGMISFGMGSVIVISILRSLINR